MRHSIFYIFLIIFFVVLTTANALATIDSSSPQNTSFQWRAGLNGLFMDDALSEARIAGVNANAKLQHKFSERFQANLDFGLVLEAGSTQQLFTEEFRPEQTFYLLDASLTWTPFQFFGIRMGALEQTHHRSPYIFISRFTFPAVLEYLEFKLDRWLISLDAQQAIPVSRSFSTRAVGKEDTPFLLTFKALLELVKPEAEEQGVFGHAHLTVFQFRNLTRGVAQDSRFYGNTVVGIGPQGARFFNDYQGIETGGSAGYKFGSVSEFSLNGNFVNNSKAPASRNKAFYLGAQFTIALNDYAISPSFGAFQTDADASPAYYTAKSIGHNNREGFVTKLNIHLKPERLNLYGQYVTANVAAASPLQADRKYIEIGFVTDYFNIDL